MAPKPEPERREVKVYGPGWRTAERVEMVPAADYDQVVAQLDNFREGSGRALKSYADRAEAAEREVERLSLRCAKDEDEIVRLREALREVDEVLGQREADMPSNERVALAEEMIGAALTEPEEGEDD